MSEIQLADYIRDVPDFPKEGILFRDITPLLASPEALTEVTEQLATPFLDKQIDIVVAAESRGFIFGVPLAMKLGAAFVPIRKPGKLPCEFLSMSYELEYGTDTLEMHADAVSKGARVLVVDDLLATGGTIEACCKMVEKAGGIVVSCAFVIELVFLAGAKKIDRWDHISLIKYE